MTGCKCGYILPGALEKERRTLREYFAAAPFPLSILSALFIQLRSSEWGAYAYFSFLTEDTIVIPNLLQNNLEIVRIVVDENDDDVPRLVPLCILNLPPLAEHASIIRLGCRAEPNPTGSSSGPHLVPAPSVRPFRERRSCS